MALVPTDILQNNIGDIVKIERTHVKIPSDVSSYTGNGARAYFKLPSEYLVDLRRSYFSVRAQATLGAGSTYCQFPYPIQSCFSRVQVFIGSTQILDVQDQGVLQGLFKVSSKYTSVVNKIEDGFYNSTQNRAQSVLPTQYEFRFNYEAMERIWPLQAIGNGGMYFVLTFAQNADCMVYDGAAPTAVFDRFEYNYSTIKPTPEVMALVDGMVAAGNYTVKFWSWESQLLTLLSGTSATSVLSLKHACCRGLVTAMRLSTTETGGAVDHAFVLGYPQANISQAQLRLGSRQWPMNPYDMSVGATGYGYNAPLLDRRTFLNFQFNSHDSQGDDFGSMGATGATNIPNAFVLAFDMRRDDTSNAYNNGFDTNSQSGDFQLYLNWSAPPGNLTQHNYLCYASTVTVRPGGGGIVVEQ